MSPEYAVFEKFSTKSEVFSFGVILLEIVSSKKNSSYYERDLFSSLIRHVSRRIFISKIGKNSDF